ncbi:hypothetical protein ES703_67421 [subsurface metagenome]
MFVAVGDHCVIIVQGMRFSHFIQRSHTFMYKRHHIPIVIAQPGCFSQIVFRTTSYFPAFYVDNIDILPKKRKTEPSGFNHKILCRVSSIKNKRSWRPTDTILYKIRRDFYDMVCFCLFYRTSG